MYDFLQESGYILIFKPVHIIKNKATKGNVDAELVLQTMIEYKNYDSAVIVSGDGDFACLVDYLYMHEKLLRLIVPNSKQFSLFLKHVAKEKIDALSDQEAQLKFVANDPTAATLDADAAIDLLPTRSPLKYLGDKIKQLLKKPQAQKKEIPASFVVKTPIQQLAQGNRAPVKKTSPLVKKPIQAQQVTKKSLLQPIQNIKNSTQKLQEIKKPFVRPVQTVKKSIQHPVQQAVQIAKNLSVPSVSVQPSVQAPQAAPVIKKHIHKHYPHPKVPVAPSSVKPIGTHPISSSQNKPIAIKPAPVTPIPNKPISNKPRSAKPFVRSLRKKASPQRYKSDFLE